jgi:hypothetical protein
LQEKADEFHRNARRAVRKASPWIVGVGRFGIAAKGMVYVIIGWLALQTAVRGAGHPVDQQGVLYSILRHRYGRIMLAALAAGLFAYTFWRIAESLLNPERERYNLKGTLTRIFRLGSGVVYGALGVMATRLLIGYEVHRRRPRDWTELVMREPLGKWLVVGIGAGILGFGLFRIWKAYTGELKGQLLLDRYTEWARDWITWVGRVGQAARGVVFAVIGAFAVVAGVDVNPAEAKGVAEALSYIEHAPMGPYLLTATALGLIAYGLFQFVEAAYRRISAE